MLYRQDPTGLIVIGQPAHAWVAGQLARAWGNEHFGEVAPWEEVCLAAEQHDLAHALWERTPKLNPQTGRPYSFLDMPANMRLALVSSASALIMVQSRYAALLVSLHFTGLYETYDLRRASDEERQAMQDFLARENTFQQQMLASLRDDPFYAPYATPEMVTRNSQPCALGHHHHATGEVLTLMKRERLCRADPIHSHNISTSCSFRAESGFCSIPPVH